MLPVFAQTSNVGTVGGRLKLSNDLLKLTGYEAEAYFKELATRTKISKVSHEFIRTKRNPWLCLCDGCGLVYSNNKATQKAIKAGCFRGSVE